MGLLRLLFSFKGRINRAQYWFATLGVGVATVFAIGFAIMMAIPDGAASNADKFAAARAAAGVLLTLSLIWIVAAWSGMAIQVKRFHDRGQTGWLTLLPMLPMLAIVYTVFTHALTGTSVAQMNAAVGPYVLVLWAINLFFFINLGCLAGTNGPNKYGDPPGSGGGLPSSAPRTPQTQTGGGFAIPGMNAKPAAEPGFALGAAQEAIDRAAAAQARAAANAAPRPAMAAAPASGGGASAPSFGRRAAR